MTRPRCRPLTVADVMIAVGFTALGLAMARSVLDTQIVTWWYTYLMIGGTPMLASWTVAFLGLRLRRPRPPIGRLFRQSGASACLAVVPTLAIWAGIIGKWWFQGDILRALNRFTYIGVSGGAAVLGVWLLRILAGTGRFEGGWIDRSGQALGISWIALMLLILFHEFS